jgi:hypothetical protein
MGYFYKILYKNKVLQINGRLTYQLNSIYKYIYSVTDLNFFSLEDSYNFDNKSLHMNYIYKWFIFKYHTRNYLSSIILITKNYAIVCNSIPIF